MSQRKFIIDGGFQTNADSVIVGNLGMTGHIIPSIDSDGTTGYDLGSPDFKWRDLYLSQGSLYIDGQKVLQSDAGTIVVAADVDQSLTTKTTGAGVLTFQSPNPIAISGTLQMGAGKRITSADGVAVVFGDKVDMDNNQVINVAAPTADGHVATKGYVDTVVSNVINGAPAALDTLNELANALGDDANFAGTVTTALSTKATITYVDAEISSLRTSTTAAIEANTGSIDAALVTAATDATLKANTALADAKDYTDGRELAITSAYQAYADLAEADAIFTAAQDATAKAGVAVTDAKDYTDAREAAITTAYQAYADQAEANAKDAAATDATFKADAAESAANAYTDGRETAITTAYTSAIATSKAASDAYADQAEADAIATANAYTDTEVAALSATVNNIISNTDGAALDSLTEIVSAFQSADSTLNGAITTLASDATSARTALETSLKAYADQAEADAISTAAADATAKADAAESAANSYTDGRETAITTAYTSAIATSKAASDAYADQAEADAITSANAYTDGRETAITTAYTSAIATSKAASDAYADAAEAAAITSANAYTDGRETAITTAYTSAIATAKTEAIDHTDARETAITTAYTSAIATAKAEANSYTDAAVSDLLDGAPAALDTLNELAAALGDDANFATTVTTSLATKAATTYVDSTVATAKAQAIATAAADATAKADAAESSAITSANSYTDGRETAITTAYQAADATLQSAINTKLAATANAVSASKWATARTISLAGDASGSVSIDGSANVTLTVAVANDSHTHDTRYVQPSQMVNFHSAPQTVTSAQSATNLSATVAFTFADLSTAKHYNVYLNRMLLRPTEYSVSGSTVTISVGVLASDDEIEVSGLKLA